MAKRRLTPGTHLYPVPAVLVTCGPYDEANIITLAWVGTLCSTPPTIGISLRPSRYSHGLIKEQSEFGVNLPPRDLLHETDYCGMVSGREACKFARTGLTPLRWTPAAPLGPPWLAHCRGGRGAAAVVERRRSARSAAEVGQGASGRRSGLRT